MKINLLGAFLATASLLAANPSQATLLYFTADLSGANEVPANASPGTGLAKFELDTEAGQLYKNGRVVRLQPLSESLEFTPAVRPQQQIARQHRADPRRSP